MTTNSKQVLGSKTAKSGFQNEDQVVDKFNNWQSDIESQEWLTIMGYHIDCIEYVYAVKLHGYKTDVQVQVTVKLKDAIDCQNIQVKLVSNPKGFNQIDKRWIDNYASMWEMPERVVHLLKLYTGDLKLQENKTLRDKRRVFADEFSKSDQDYLIGWLKSKQTLIVSDILKGRGEFAAEWMLIILKSPHNSKWALKSINICLNHFGNGDIIISPRGTIKIARITMQRKGGDAGRPTANMLQFKINPAELFDIQ